MPPSIPPAGASTTAQLVAHQSEGSSSPPASFQGPTGTNHYESSRERRGEPQDSPVPPNMQPSLLNPALAGRAPAWPPHWPRMAKLFQPMQQGTQLPYPLSFLLLSLLPPSFQLPRDKHLRLQEMAGSVTVQAGRPVRHTAALARLSLAHPPAWTCLWTWPGPGPGSRSSQGW